MIFLVEVNETFINIEVNKSKRYTDDILTKCNYYMYSLLRGDISINKNTKKYQHLHKKIIQVNLNTFSMYADVFDPRQVFVLYDVVNSLVIKSSNAEIHHINIDMCLNEWYNRSNKEVDNLTLWYALIEANTKEEVRKIIASPGFLSEREKERIEMTMEEIDYSRYYFETLTLEEERQGFMESAFEADMEDFAIIRKELEAIRDDLNVEKEEIMTEKEKVKTEKEEINALKKMINNEKKKLDIQKKMHNIYSNEEMNKIIKNMLIENMDIDSIIRITNVDESKILEIKNNLLD